MTASAIHASSHVHARLFLMWTMQHRATMSDLLSPPVHALSCWLSGNRSVLGGLQCISGEAARLKSLSSPVRCAEQGGRHIPQPALGGGRAHVPVPLAPLSQARHLRLPLGERSSQPFKLLSTCSMRTGSSVAATDWAPVRCATNRCVGQSPAWKEVLPSAFRRAVESMSCSLHDNQ